jgi:hypothetical protein
MTLCRLDDQAMRSALSIADYCKQWTQPCIVEPDRPQDVELVRRAAQQQVSIRLGLSIKANLLLGHLVCHCIALGNRILHWLFFTTLQQFIVTPSI